MIVGQRCFFGGQGSSVINHYHLALSRQSQVFGEKWDRVVALPAKSVTRLRVIRYRRRHSLAIVGF